MRRHEKKISSGAVRLLGALLLVVVFAVNAFVVLDSFERTRYELKAGDTVQSDIIAPKNSIDHYVSDLRRSTARDAVPTVYEVDESVVTTLTQTAKETVERCDAMLDDLTVSVWEANANHVGTSIGLPQGYVWESMITEAQLAAKLLEYDLGQLLDVKSAYRLLNLQLPTNELRIKGRLSETGGADMAKNINELLKKGVSEGGLEDKRQEAIGLLQKSGLCAAYKNELIEPLVKLYVQPTLAVNAKATEEAKSAAAMEVENVLVEKGNVLIKAGKVVTEYDILRLSGLDLLANGATLARARVGAIAYVLCIFALLATFIKLYDGETLNSIGKMLSLSLILLMTLGLAKLFTILEPRLTPALLLPILVFSLHGRRDALLLTITAAFSCGVLVASPEYALFSPGSMQWCFAWLVGGLACICGGSALNRRSAFNKRSGMIVSGLIGAASGGLAAVLYGLISGESFSDIFMDFGLFVCGGVISIIVALGLSVIWENLFDLPTDARLSELMNSNHPLLKRMIAYTPGSYHHCVAASQLAENAAEEIGANAVLTKTAALYHDVGKLRRPNYFWENLGNTANPHDALEPFDSARIIIAHQQDAEAILQKYRIPKDVRRIVREHHGTTLVAYFYMKAQKADKRVVESDFRYGGPRPSSRESAIVMLADCCEAAVRSLTNPTPQDIEKMVGNIVQGKLSDGQFNTCPITLEELEKIKTSFLKTFVGMAHDRISYNEEKE